MRTGPGPAEVGGTGLSESILLVTAPSMQFCVGAGMGMNQQVQRALFECPVNTTKRSQDSKSKERFASGEKA